MFTEDMVNGGIFSKTLTHGKASPENLVLSEISPKVLIG